MAGAYARFVDINGTPLQGASKDEARPGDKGWVEIQSMSSPIYRSSSGAEGEGVAGTTTVGDIVLVRKIDASSPKFAQAAACGTAFKDVLIDFGSDLGPAQPGKSNTKSYFKMLLKNVYISGYSVHGSKGGRDDFGEEVTLNAREIEWYYQAFDDKGAPDAKNKGMGSYDPSKNAPKSSSDISDWKYGLEGGKLA